MIARRKRALLAMAVTALLLAAFDAWVVLQPGQIEAQVEARLGRLLGGSVDVDGLHAGLDGLLRADRLLWTPGSGAGAQQGIALRGVRLAIERLPLVVGRVQIQRVEVQAGDTTLAALQSLLDRLVTLPERPRADLTSARLAVRRLTIAGVQRLLPVPIPGTARPILLERLRISADRDGIDTLRAVATARASGLSQISLGARISLVQRRIDLEVRASNVEVGGALTARLPGLVDPRLGALRLEGPVDLDARLGFPLDGRGAVTISGTIACFTLAIRPGGLEGSISNVRGRIRVDGPSVRVEGLRGRLGNGELRLRGAVEDVRTLAGLDLELEGQDLAPGVLCQIEPRPPCLALLERLQLVGTVGLDVRLTGSATSGAGLSEEIALRFHDGAALGGLGERLSGEMRTTRSSAPHAPAPAPAPARLRLGEAWVGGWQVRGLTAQVKPEGARVVFAGVEASVAGGRIAGRAWVDPGGAKAQAAAFGLELHGVGLELRRLLQSRVGFDLGPGEVTKMHVQVTKPAGAPHATIRLEGRVRGADPLAWALARPLADALRALGYDPEPSQKAHAVLQASPDGRWTFQAQLLCPGVALSVDGSWDPARGLSGRAIVRAPQSHDAVATFRLSGSLGATKLTRESAP